MQEQNKTNYNIWDHTDTHAKPYFTAQFDTNNTDKPLADPWIEPYFNLENINDQNEKLVIMLGIIFGSFCNRIIQIHEIAQRNYKRIDKNPLFKFHSKYHTKKPNQKPIIDNDIKLLMPPLEELLRLELIKRKL